METLDEEYIEVHGQRIKMIKKVCEGGCKREFKVSEGCKNKYYFADCEERCTSIKISAEEHKKRFNPMHGRPKRITPIRSDEDENWTDSWTERETLNNLKPSADWY